MKGRSAPRESEKAASTPAPSGQDTSAEATTASYIYGIVPADVELASDVHGVGDPPGKVELVRHGEIAALISDVPVEHPLGRPQDLFAHQRLLDDTAAEVPVLPLRFGAVVKTPQAVVDELLTPHHEEFLAVLRDLEGRAQFVVRGRYNEEKVIGEILAENAEAARLREQIRGLPEEATWDARIRLGEVIGQAVEASRETDTQTLARALASVCVAVAVREPSHEWDAAHLALLVETDRRADVEAVLDEFGHQWGDRVTLRLSGPLAPYDFVGSPE
ncbi:gas vesicle protein [Streptosporangium violaceochromogenes]|nr:gas vesicle protein [Streptosporangium violaceochromogenes]